MAWTIFQLIEKFQAILFESCPFASQTLIIVRFHVQKTCAKTAFRKPILNK